MGSVNLAALEEYEVQKERFEFLTRQRDDLLEAEEIVKRTIKRIDRTARQRFLIPLVAFGRTSKIRFRNFLKAAKRT